MNNGWRQLSLVKGAHRYVFRYQPGREADVIAAFASMADDHDSDFDWFDAAALVSTRAASRIRAGRGASLADRRIRFVSVGGIRLPTQRFARGTPKARL